MKSEQKNKMRAYLSVAAGSSCIAGSALGSPSVVVYNSGDAADLPNSLSFESKAGISLNYYYLYFDSSSVFGYDSNNDVFFDGSADSIIIDSIAFGDYANNGPVGAVVGDQNYASIDFDGDGIFESVAQFDLDFAGGGSLIAIATTNDASDPLDLSNPIVGDPDSGTALSLTDGFNAINGIPEPSSISLLALGSLGLMTRRNRKSA